GRPVVEPGQGPPAEMPTVRAAHVLVVVVEEIVQVPARSVRAQTYCLLEGGGNRDPTGARAPADVPHAVDIPGGCPGLDIAAAHSIRIAMDEIMQRFGVGHEHELTTTDHSFYLCHQLYHQQLEDGYRMSRTGGSRGASRVAARGGSTNAICAPWRLDPRRKRV